jgi:RHS repeat-associated protein
MLGRVIRTVEAFADFNPSAADDRTTEYTYDGSGHVLTLTAGLPDGQFQRMQYVYGVTTSAGSNLTSNDLLATVKYPDKSTGLPSSSAADQESYRYNALGQVTAKIDRNQNASAEIGTIHAFSYDVVGRQTSEAITVLGDGLDDTVLRLDTAYDTAGRPSLFTSCDSATSCGASDIVNQVQREYNGLGQLITEHQEHAGDVDTGSLKVQYAYSEMSNGNHSRPTSLTYPNGRVVNYVYGSGLDDDVSRVTSFTTSGATLEQYAYLGLGTVVKRTHPDGGDEIGLTYLTQGSEGNGEAGDPYLGLDRFGRVIDQRWIDSGSVSTPLDRFQYGHDRNSNRLYRENLVNDEFSELYHANGASEGYDNLNQLTAFSRGEFTSGKHTIGSPEREQEWDLDAMGNWESITTDSVEQGRQHNRQNQVTDVESNELAFDDNGNTIVDECGSALVYDAWNRLVGFDNGADSAMYVYDALNRRVQETESATDFYYSDKWQVLEDRISGTAHSQYVWSPVYVDAMILRDRDANAQSSDGMEERLYVMQDANWNVTGLASASGTVLERYVYDPYGATTVLEADWDVVGDPSESAYDWVYLHQGGRYDAASGLYSFRHRELSPALGRWMQLDPLGYAAGDANLYRYIGNGVTTFTDPTGLEKFYVCSRPVDLEGIAGKCDHTDIFSDEDGRIYQGAYGPCPPEEQKGLPKGAKWSCIQLPISDTKLVPNSLGGIREIPKTFEWGPNAGKSCKGATATDVKACIKAKPKYRGTPGIISNCQTDVWEAADGCCLAAGAFNPATLLPPNLVIPTGPGKL